MQIFVAGKGDHVGLVAAGVGHEPDTHFNDYAEGRLREDAVVVGPETVVEEVPGAVSGAVVRRNLLEIYFVSGTALASKSGRRGYGGVGVDRWVGQSIHSGAD